LLFNSYIFILLFLPLALIGYFGLNSIKKETLAKIFLTLMSLWFYAYFNYSYLFIILGSIFCNFILSKQIEKNLQNIKLKKVFLSAGIIFNIGIIFYFKYFNFFMENVNVIFRTDYVFKEILMPLGISFFTFQQISYLVDSTRGETKNYSFVDYALFVSFFPQLVAGPIVFHDEILPQFKDSLRKKINQGNIAKGLWIISVGLAKKVLIADVIAKGVNYGFENTDLLSTADAWLVVLCYTLQIYFDFSGYCDMAIGIAKMFNIDLPLNFNSPYKATSVTDFWKRWHMTLTRFLTKYLYIPLGGNRKGFARTLCNILIVYLISGLWHGAAWTFIVWGLMHGIVRVFERITWKYIEKIPGIIRTVFTFVFINITWVIFRATTIENAFQMYRKMFTWNGAKFSNALMEQFDILELTYIEEHIHALQNFVTAHTWVNMSVIVAIAIFIVFGTRNCHEKDFKPTIINAITTIILLVWSVISLSGFSEFLYFNF